MLVVVVPSSKTIERICGVTKVGRERKREKKKVSLFLPAADYSRSTRKVTIVKRNKRSLDKKPSHERNKNKSLPVFQNATIDIFNVTHTADAVVLYAFEKIKNHYWIVKCRSIDNFDSGCFLPPQKIRLSSSWDETTLPSRYAIGISCWLHLCSDRIRKQIENASGKRQIVLPRNQKIYEIFGQISVDRSLEKRFLVFRENNSNPTHPTAAHSLGPTGAQTVFCF
jgi:hypothetical protein